MSIHSKREMKTEAKPDKDRPMPKVTTPRYGHAVIDMRTRMYPDEPERAGDFYWSVDDRQRYTLVLAVPAQNPRGWILTEWTINHKNESGASWKWDLDKVKPTLHPSIHAVGIYHGWVEGGKLREA